MALTVLIFAHNAVIRKNLYRHLKKKRLIKISNGKNVYGTLRKRVKNRNSLKL